MNHERTATKCSYKSRIAVYQLAKLRMLEFHNDFLDRFTDIRDFKLIQINRELLHWNDCCS